jgi:hypothetical protein
MPRLRGSAAALWLGYFPVSSTQVKDPLPVSARHPYSSTRGRLRGKICISGAGLLLVVGGVSLPVWRTVGPAAGQRKITRVCEPNARYCSAAANRQPAEALPDQARPPRSAGSRTRAAVPQRPGELTEYIQPHRPRNVICEVDRLVSVLPCGKPVTALTITRLESLISPSVMPLPRRRLALAHPGKPARRRCVTTGGRCATGTGRPGRVRASGPHCPAPGPSSLATLPTVAPAADNLR